MIAHAAVRDAIVDAIDGVSDPADVTAAHLATITSLDLSYTYNIFTVRW